LKKALNDVDSQLVMTTSMHGTLRAGTKKLPIIRAPMAFATDFLQVEDALPPGAIFVGLMIVPTKVIDPEKMAELEQDEAAQEGEGK
jgi:hypothetical protein